MKAFAELYAALDGSTSTHAKLQALVEHFQRVGADDAAWAAYVLAGGKPRQVVPTAVLRRLACERAGIEDWLFDECYQAVGDLAETIAHVLPPGPAVVDDPGLAHWFEARLLPLRGLPAEAQSARIAAWWDELDPAGRFLLTKLIGGGFRVGVSRLLVQRAIAAVAGLPDTLVAQRMMGYTDAGHRPGAEAWRALVAPLPADASGEPGVAAPTGGQPWPFFLAHPLDDAAEDLEAHLGPPGDWQVEWKYDGIRAQVVRRDGLWIWSRGEELVTDRFPEVAASLAGLPPGTVLDGEILAVDPADPGRPAPFTRLQRRIGRKTLTKRLLRELPATYVAYDLLEADGQDQRARPLGERRARLQALAQACGFELSPLVEAATWAEYAALRETARERGVEGFMLKHRAGVYGVGRRREAAPRSIDSDAVAAAPAGRGGWLKWKVAPLTVDAVLVYAQAGHGRRASLYTDYTFAVWNRPPRDSTEAAEALAVPPPRGDGAASALQLVPVAKAYSGLTDAEIRRVDQVIRRTTRDKFGPVRSVQPTLLFELGFEGVNASPRHRSGVALRFPRILRIRDDKPLHEADTLAALQALAGLRV